MINRNEITDEQVIPDEFEENLNELLEALNKLRKKFGKPMFVNSGYRTPEHNKSIGGAKNSNHCKCLAVDFKRTPELVAFCKANDYAILKECGLYLESTESTKTWVHLQIIAPRSGKREFIP